MKSLAVYSPMAKREGVLMMLVMSHDCTYLVVFGPRGWRSSASSEAAWIGGQTLPASFLVVVRAYIELGR